MKNTTKTIAVVLALFLVAACFVGAASAAPTYNGELREVTDTNDAFVYEKITIAGQTLTANSKLSKFSGDASPVAQNTISASVTGTTYYFDLIEAAVGSYTGTYYLDATVTGSTIISPATVNVWNPEMALKVYLNQNYDSIDGKTINKETPIKFIIESPKVGPAQINAQAKILFTTPVGGKTTAIGNGGIYDFSSVDINAAQVNANDQITPMGAAPVNMGSNAAAGTYVAQAEFLTMSTNEDGYPFSEQIPDKYKKSNTVSFTVQSTSLTLTANKDSVVRSNPFTVTIQGDSQTIYFVYLDGASESDVNPTLQPDQNGQQFATANAWIPAKNGNKYLVINSQTVPATKADVPANLQDTYGYFKTDASGKRTIQYNTNADTEDKTYTIKTYLMDKTTTPVAAGGAVVTQTYDSVKVKVEKGAVTITASGDRSYYIGEEIKLTGTNTDSSEVFLFITGPNLDTDGIVLQDVKDKTPARLNGKYESVKTDNTWEFKWDTSNCGLDTGAYTIYATSLLTNGKSSSATVVDNTMSKIAATTENCAKYGISASSADPTKQIAVKLSDAEYATVSVNLKQPFLSATPSGTTVAKGDKIYIRGTAEGDPNNLKLYIFGPNFFEPYSVTVEDDGSYEKKVDIPDSMSSNQYFVVIQHPMYNGVFDADLNTAGTVFEVKNVVGTTSGAQASFIVKGDGKLQGSNAADALTKMIDNANIDDIYTKLTFTVQEAWIKINNPGDQAVGTTFTITGTTNLAVDDQILIEVVSSSFNAIDKTSTSTTSGFSQTTKVVKGDGNDNAWSIEVDSTNFKLDEYTIKASGIEADVTSTTNFNLVEKVNPTVTPTATVTGQPTTTATTAVPTDAPKTPGFGAFLALAGLGAVALLVLRRN